MQQDAQSSSSSLMISIILGLLMLAIPAGVTYIIQNTEVISTNRADIDNLKEATSELLLEKNKGSRFTQNDFMDYRKALIVELTGLFNKQQIHLEAYVDKSIQNQEKLNQIRCQALLNQIKEERKAYRIREQENR